MTRGGHRPNAGGAPAAESPRTHDIRIPVSPAEHAELLGASGAKPLATWMRELGLKEARRTK